jgi:hypothetical protein
MEYKTVVGKNGFVLHFFISEAVKGHGANGGLLLRVYPARQRIPGLIRRKLLKACRKYVGEAR